MQTQTQQGYHQKHIVWLDILDTNIVYIIIKSPLHNVTDSLKDFFLVFLDFSLVGTAKNKKIKRVMTYLVFQTLRDVRNR